MGKSNSSSIFIMVQTNPQRIRCC